MKYYKLSFQFSINIGPMHRTLPWRLRVYNMKYALFTSQLETF